MGTCPLRVASTTSPDERYQQMTDAFGIIGRNHLTCGMHVHVSIATRAEGVTVLDRIRPWLPTLLALSANSPYWQDEDTSYASYRHVALGLWPSAGPTEEFGDEAGYDAAVAHLINSGAALDEGMIYFDARLSARYPTVEIRAADVTPRLSSAVMVAALCRALVETAVQDAPRRPQSDCCANRPAASRDVAGSAVRHVRRPVRSGRGSTCRRLESGRQAR